MSMAATESTKQTCDMLRDPLNDIDEIDRILDEFKATCESYDKHHRKRCKHRYYNVGIMAKVVTTTTDEEMQALLGQGVRTFLVDTVTQQPSDIDAMLTLVKATTEQFETENAEAHQLTGLALEIQGDSCRFGRLRNNESLYLQAGEHITLTMENKYRYSGYKSIAFVLNLEHYIKALSLSDVVMLGSSGCRGRIVKMFPDKVALLIEVGGPVSSYDLIELPNQCYLLNPENLKDIFTVDLELADEVKANFIVITKIRCKSFMTVLRQSIKASYDFKVIGSIDYDFMREKLIDLRGIVELLDYLWIPDMFDVDECMANYIYAELIPLAKCLKKPIIGTVPLEKCSDFRRFENHQFLWHVDAFFIEKSSWCFKYPLIVKRLMPLKDLQRGVLENNLEIREYASNLQGVLSFIIRTISTIECQAIILHARSQSTAEALACVEIYCPVLVMLSLEDETDEKWTKNLARSMNLRRNLRAVFFTKEANECDLRPIDYGIRYYRKLGLLETGDFVITLEMCQKDGEHVRFGVGDDVVLIRATYLPPAPICDQYLYA